MRDKQCVFDGSVCQDAHSFKDPNVLKVSDMRAKGLQNCPVISICQRGSFEAINLSCTPLMGIHVARFVLKQGNALSHEMEVFKKEIAQADRRGFFDPYDDPKKVITNLNEVCDMVQKWAETVLNLNPLDSDSFGQAYTVAPCKSDAQCPVLQGSIWDSESNVWLHKCGTTLARAEVIHPIHDSGIPLAGSGRTHTEEVPYCPKCNQKPPQFGIPLTKDLGEERELEFFRRIRSTK